MTFGSEVGKWCVQEITVEGRKDGNPFTDYTIKGIFCGKNEKVTVNGFYDGDGFIK